jgi:hypothetical protein
MTRYPGGMSGGVPNFNKANTEYVERMNGPLFIDMPKTLLRTNREDGSETALVGDMEIRRAIGVIAENYGLDWGQVITALDNGHTFQTISFCYERPKG